MKKYYISFGQSHIHKLDHAVIDSNCIVEVDAPDERTARRGANALFKCKYSICYDQIPNMKHFPRGIFDIFGNSIEQEGVYSLRQFI
jgi:hypothetical protein